jgi:predicted O-methyltransferase YrrM
MAAIATLDLEQYSKDLQQIPGWFWPVDMFLFAGINQLQKAEACTGDILEIGVYHGKSSVLLGYFLHPPEELMVCDTFESEAIQEQNLTENQKYYANVQRQTFEQNFARFHSRSPRIFTCSSTDLIHHIPLSQSFRFIHIDGSHLYEVVRQDVRLSQHLLKDKGVVVFDDYRSPHTPGVSAALWDAVLHNGLHPFCLSPAKMYAHWGERPPFDIQDLLTWLQNHGMFHIDESNVGGNRMLIVDISSSVSAKYELAWHRRLLWNLKNLVKPVLA